MLTITLFEWMITIKDLLSNFSLFSYHKSSSIGIKSSRIEFNEVEDLNTLNDPSSPPLKIVFIAPLSNLPVGVLNVVNLSIGIQSESLVQDMEIKDWKIQLWSITSIDRPLCSFEAISNFVWPFSNPWLIKILVYDFLQLHFWSRLDQTSD